MQDYEALLIFQAFAIAFEVWEKLKATYEITTPVNQVHLMRKLVCINLMSQKVQLITINLTIARLQIISL